MMTEDIYIALQNHFDELLKCTSSVLSTAELHELTEYTEANEYGLALQTFADIVLDEDKRLPQRAVVLCEELVELMRLEQEINMSAIRAAAN